jgi:ATP-binding cassette subfamily B protein
MNESFRDFAKLNIKINRTFAVMMPLVMLIMSLVTVAIIWFGAGRINLGLMQIGDVMAIIEYAMNILMYVIMAVFTLIYIPRARVCAARIREVLEYTPEICDSDSPATLGEEVSLEFRNVGFGYRNAENAVLKDISFKCKVGTVTAIIGGTGSGKSTLARLIPRLIDTTTGEVLLNGVNVKDLPQKSVRERVGFVPQKAFLFSGTIEDNMRGGSHKVSEADIAQALEIAQAKDFVDELVAKQAGSACCAEGKPHNGVCPELIAQGGKNLSGGQRQRLSIARMLAKKPDICVFDDSFSALDFKTDAALRQSLKSVTADAVVINIAQRISTIRDAQQIIVLDEGAVAGIGTHDELMESCEVYQEIARSQLSEAELTEGVQGGRALPDPAEGKPHSGVCPELK